MNFQNKRVRREISAYPDRKDSRAETGKRVKLELQAQRDLKEQAEEMENSEPSPSS